MADDNEATCTLITALLHRAFHVDIAHDGMDAIAKLKRRPYAVILLDLLMPLVDGYAVLDYLRAERPELLRRVLVVTASLVPREMQRVSAYEVRKVIAKPFEIDELAAAVKECAADADNGDGERGLRDKLITTGMLLLFAATAT